MTPQPPQDIKAGNVLLTDRGVAKLADVGTSRLQTHTFLSELPLVGTFAWCVEEWSRPAAAAAAAAAGGGGCFRSICGCAAFDNANTAPARLRLAAGWRPRC